MPGVTKAATKVKSHTYSGSWDKRQAVVDHLLRASKRVVLNRAERARLLESPDGSD